MNILCAIVHYQTPDLLKTAAQSFKKYYPHCPLLIVDNGSTDGSAEKVKELGLLLPETETLFFKENIFHGPAMDQIMRKYADKEYVFFLDSDTETLKPGFLEPMADYLDVSKDHYGIGEVVSVNKRGFKSEAKNTTPVLLTPYMLLRRSLYIDLPPFIHHGQPTLHNFKEAFISGYQLGFFPVSTYIDHLWRGTADRYGYGLGLRSKWDYLMNKLGM